VYVGGHVTRGTSDGPASEVTASVSPTGPKPSLPQPNDMAMTTIHHNALAVYRGSTRTKDLLAVASTAAAP
jgi:hypothetical protein